MVPAPLRVCGGGLISENWVNLSLGRIHSSYRIGMLSKNDEAAVLQVSLTSYIDPEFDFTQKMDRGNTDNLAVEILVYLSVCIRLDQKRSHWINAIKNDSEAPTVMRKNRSDIVFLTRRLLYGIRSSVYLENS